MGLENFIKNKEDEKVLEYHLRKAITSLSEFLQIRITDEAYQKLFYTAKKWSELTSSMNIESAEVLMWLLNDEELQKKGDVAVRDIYIPHQVVNASFCSTDLSRVESDYARIEGDDIKKVGEMNYKKIGWAHSHGILDVFHSEPDDKTTIAHVNSVIKPILELNKGGIRIGKEINYLLNLNHDFDRTKGILNIKFGDDEKQFYVGDREIKEEDGRITLPLHEQTEFGYSIVVNSKEDYFPVIGVHFNPIGTINESENGIKVLTKENGVKLKIQKKDDYNEFDISEEDTETLFGEKNKEHSFRRKRIKSRATIFDLNRLDILAQVDTDLENKVRIESNKYKTLGEVIDEPQKYFVKDSVVQDLQNKIKSLRAERVKGAEEANLYKIKIKELGNYTSSLEKKVEVGKKQIRTYESELQDKSDELNHFKNEKNEEITRLLDKNGEISKEYENLQINYGKLNEELNKLKEKTPVKDSLKKYEEELGNKTNEIEKLIAQRRLLEEDYSKLKEENKRYESKIDTLEREVKIIEDSLKTESERVSYVEDSLRGVLEKISEDKTEKDYKEQEEQEDQEGAEKITRPTEITNEGVNEIREKNRITKEKPSFGKKFRKVIYAGLAAVLLGLIGIGVAGTYDSLNKRPHTQPQIRTAKIYETTQEQTATIETIVEGKSKVFFYEGTNVQVPQTAEYTIQKGDRVWSLAKALGIKQEKIPAFVNELVDNQKEYENSESFLERISKDTSYVSNGKVNYGKDADGIKGDSLKVGDSFYIDESLVNKYEGDFEKAKELGKLIVKEKPVKQVEKKIEKAQKPIKQKQEQPTQEQKANNENVGLYMQGQEKPFGIFKKDFANDAEKYYETLSGQDIIKSEVKGYSTPLSIKLPVLETQRITENYIKARLGKDMNMDVMEAYSLLDNLSRNEKSQFVKDFERDFEKAKNGIQSMYKKGKNIEQIAKDSEYVWVDEGFVKNIVKNQDFSF